MNKAPVKFFLVATLTIFFSLFFYSSGSAQEFKKPDKYLHFITKRREAVVKKFLRYNSAITTGAKTKKQHSLLKKLIARIQKSKTAIGSMPPFKFDKLSKDSLMYKDSTALKDSAVAFMKFYYRELKENYRLFNGLKKGTEESYDSMKIKLLTRALVYKKLEDANVKLTELSIKFANIKSAKKDKIGKLMEQCRGVISYYDSLYLIFFKSYSTESALLSAVYKKNVKEVETNKNKLSKYAQAGLDQLDTLAPYKKDNSLIKNDKYILAKYVKETDKQFDNIPDYFSKAEDFQKTKTEYERKPKHPAKDVAEYRKYVKEFNKALKHFNKTMHKVFKTRKHLLNRWEFAADNFLENHIQASIYIQ